MSGDIRSLSENLNGWCTFIDEKHQILLIAPPKCGSTSIFKLLYNKLTDQNLIYERTFSHEYTSDLCIHKHLKLNQDSTSSNLERIFLDHNFKKILVTRDPIDRLSSAICSKYLITNAPHYQFEIKDKGHDEKGLLQPYLSTDDFLHDFNKLAYILLTKGSVYGDQRSSHASPISDMIPKRIIPFFSEIIDITKKEGWIKLKNSINQHLNQYSEHLKIESFPHVNENPLSNSKRFLTRQNITIAYGRYTEDYTNFRFEHPNPDEHQQTPPSIQELKSLNTFISLANRSADLYDIGKSLINEEKDAIRKKNIVKLKSLKNSFKTKLKLLKVSHQAMLNEAIKLNARKLSELTIKNKQLIVLEELSRRTAEELLKESHGLKELNNKLKEDIKNQSNDLNEEIQNHSIHMLAEETSALDLTTLTRRAEKRIRNKNFRSAQELLNKAYLMDKNNRSILLRLWAVSTKNPVIRSLMLWITPSAKSSRISLNGV